MSFYDTPPEVNCDEPESFKCDGCKKTDYDKPNEVRTENKDVHSFVVHEYCYECYDKILEDEN